jgi:hypothetical protein
MTLKGGSKLQGEQVVIEAPLSQISFQDSSVIDTSGKSMMTVGTSKWGGASFVGKGGICQSSVKYTVDVATPYGKFDTVPFMDNLAYHGNQIGSVGYAGEAETAGGGRIVIICDSIQVKSNKPILKANAKPYIDQDIKYLYRGGSGGYIYVFTFSKRA